MMRDSCSPSADINRGSSWATHVYPLRQPPLQVRVQKVAAVRLGSKRHSTQTLLPGQLSGSQPTIVQAPPGWAVSQMRSPVAEQSVELPQESPILGAHPSANNEAHSNAAKRQRRARTGLWRAEDEVIDMALAVPCAACTKNAGPAPWPAESVALSLAVRVGHDPHVPVLYQAFRRALTVAVELYFVDVQARGTEHIPAQGPVVFVANHPNSLMDVVVLGSRTGRSIQFMARSGLFSNPLAASLFRSMGVIPVYRAQDSAEGAGAKNDDMFRAAFDVLEEGGAIGIFPEGQNAPARHVRDIKTGAARIALGAEARRDFGVGVRIVPVGLNYVERDRFHTSALVRVGEPLLTSDYRDLYASDPRAAVRKLTDDMQEAMREQAVHITNLRNTEFVNDVLEVYGATLLSDVLGSTPDLRLPQQKLLDRATGREGRGEHLPDRFEAEQRIADAVQHFEESHPDVYARMRRRLGAYQTQLRLMHLRADFAEQSARRTSSRREAIRLALYAVLVGPIAAYGLAHNFVPYRLTRMAALRAPDEPIRAVTGLAGGILFFGLFYALYGWLAWHGTASMLGAGLYVTTLPFAGFWFLRYWQRLGQYADRIKVRTLFLSQKGLYRRALVERQLLLAELDALRVTYMAEREAERRAAQQAKQAEDA